MPFESSLFSSAQPFFSRSDILSNSSATVLCSPNIVYHGVSGIGSNSSSTVFSPTVLQLFSFQAKFLIRSPSIVTCKVGRLCLCRKRIFSHVDTGLLMEKKSCVVPHCASPSVGEWPPNPFTFPSLRGAQRLCTELPGMARQGQGWVRDPHARHSTMLYSMQEGALSSNSAEGLMKHGRASREST